MTIPKRPIRKRLRGLPAFTTIRGGAYFSSTVALEFLEGGEDADGCGFGRYRRRVSMEDVMTESPQFIGLLGQREIVLIQKILHENDATEEE